MLRTHTCGKLTKKEVKKEVVLCGWVQTRRDHGGVIFIDLRDRYGLTQVVFNPDSKAFKEADKLRREDCIQVKGKVTPRKEGMINKSMKTGEIEVISSGLNVLNKSKTPPIEVDDRVTASDDLRLKYRYLDLRRPSMQKKFAFRHVATQAVREYLNSQNFLEIETPMLMKSTPEGARDYVVPSRVNPGKFYALPQSPQLYKQLFMVSGFDRYYQMARCMRDEDLRADRQPEFTQIDLEMSFVEQGDVMKEVEACIKNVVKRTLGKTLNDKFKVISYDESMDRFGTDKPDLRFGLELVDVTSIVKKSDFQVFKDAELVKCLPVPREMGRKEIDRLIEWAKENGAKGLAWMKVKGDTLESSIVKFFGKDVQAALLKATKIDGGTLFFVADKKKTTNEVLARLRNKMGKDLDLIKPGDLKFLWVTNYPLFEWNEDEDKWDPAHHMFSMPRKEHIPLLEKDPGKVYATLYDLVLNGSELGSGSIRVHDPDIQERIMKVVGFPKKLAEERFGFLLESFKYGAPPHGGFAVGFDRLVALLMGITDIREVIAFPKNKNAESPMDGSPAELAEKDLTVLKLKLEKKK